MRIGFAGAHRTGKTALARIIARCHQAPLVDSPMGKVANDYQFNMATDNRLTSNGMVMQREQQAELVRRIEAAGPRFVADRTPIDTAAYLMADATAPAGADTDYPERVVEYVERAMRLTAELFDVVILVPPAITFELLDGKPPINPAYQEHIHQLIRGFLYDDEFVGPRVCQIKRTNIVLADRANAVLNFVFGPDVQVDAA